LAQLEAKTRAAAPKPKASAESYEKRKARATKAQAAQSESGRDIGPLPPVKNPARKAAGRRSFRAFCDSYLTARFPIPWSRDHLEAIDTLETTVLKGGQFAFGMPRGSGKTSLCEAAAAWAMLYGHRSFLVLIGATEAAAEELLDSIKAELETNDLLLEDFPEVCYPVRCLEGIHNRAAGQTLNGERTRITWSQKELIFPTVAGSDASGRVVRVTGITGRIRGMKANGPAGSSIRPDLVITDDPQTDESANSPTQNATREKLLAGAVLGLAGPKKKIAAVVPCTVIAPGDMADRILDPERHPAWHGKRFKMVYAMPSNAALWDQYAELRRVSLRDGGAGEDATEFYRARRAEMDAGAVVAWPERFNPDEISAVQHAMNRHIDNPRAFAAEAQNEPLADAIAGKVEDLEADQVAEKTNRAPRGTVPPEFNRLTAFIDVGAHIMYWCVCAWRESDFAGAIVDYGTTPKQTRGYFAASDARPKLDDLFEENNYDEAARVYAGLRLAADHVAGRAWPRQDGNGEMRVERLMVDAGWLPDTVQQFCRQSALAPVLLPSKGFATTASTRPINEWARREGERVGDNWRIVPQTGSGRGRLCVFDPNHWKSFVAGRLLTPEGGAGCLQLFGTAADHQLFADHLTAEYRIRTSGRGRTVDEWKVRPESRDNHFFDSLVGCAVAASTIGVSYSAAAATGEAVKKKGRRKLDIEELYKLAQQQGNAA